MSLTRRLTVRLAAVALVFSAIAARGQETFYVDYSKHPDARHLLAYPLSILSPDTEADLAPARAAGNRLLAYLSLVEVAPDAPYRDALKAAGVPFLRRNETWGGDLVDIASPAWRKFVLDELGTRAAERGFDGFFLDTVDSAELLAEAQPARAAEFRAAAVRLVQALRKRFPDKRLVLNRGFDLLPELHASVDGVLIESVFRTFDPETKTYLATDDATRAALADRIAAIRALKLPVYVLDYVAPGDRDTARETERLIRGLGAAPFLTTPALQGRLGGDLGHAPRRILVVYGYDPEEAEAHRLWAADTTTAAILQMPLEWMGYETVYHDVAKGPPAEDDYAGVILDEELEIPFAMEHDYATWLLGRIEAGEKVLFLGSYAFSDSHERGRLFGALGIRGSDDSLTPAGEPRFAELDKSIVNFEIDALPSRRNFENLAAPEGARVLLGVEASENADGSGETQRHDTAYHASWGGALLAPYIVFEASEETLLQYADPFAFLEGIWPSGRFPAPDPSTRDGLRLFYTHIDGDGFSSLSSVEPGKTCAEVLLDRVLTKLPWPITVSVVESELRGQMLSQQPGEAETLSEIARKIFRLPHVEAASHSYSHPYLWIEGDTQFLDLYDRPNLELKLTARYPKIEMEREIAGSMTYINEKLAAAGRPAGLMLWSGDCRPSPEALAVCESHGFENLNGGNTILCRRYPGLFGVAPRVMDWDGHLQIHAANQNEFMYTDGWAGASLGGFAQVVETFEMTEAGRRLKPVNVYYHFYSAERPDALAALESIYDWCRKQELHAVTALDFAALTRDSYHTELVRTGDRRWTALNAGRLRTYRLPANLGTPDIARSRGVTGYRARGEWIYLHTDGRPAVEIALADAPDAVPYLESSDAEIAVDSMTASGLRVAAGKRPATLRLAGFPAGSTIRLRTAAGPAKELTASAEGRLDLLLPASETATLTLSR